MGKFRSVDRSVSDRRQLTFWTDLCPSHEPWALVPWAVQVMDDGRVVEHGTPKALWDPKARASPAELFHTNASLDATWLKELLERDGAYGLQAFPI